MILLPMKIQLKKTGQSLHSRYPLFSIISKKEKGRKIYWRPGSRIFSILLIVIAKSPVKGIPDLFVAIGAWVHSHAGSDRFGGG